MNKLFTLLLLFLTSFVFSQGASCATAIVLADGNCLINQGLPGSANMAGLCVGGTNPSIFIRFRAGTCPQFRITPNFSMPGVNDQIGYTIRTTACAAVTGSTNCVGNIVNGETFTINSRNSSGTQLLTSGTDYILQIWGAVGTNSFNICYTANTREQASNECSGALPLGTTSQSFFNGGDCAFSGSLDDATTSDPAASTLCAGSLENTQWVQFSPQAGVGSFEISGSNISCTGGGCGFQFGIFSGTCASLVSEGCYGRRVDCGNGGNPNAEAGPTNVTGGLANIAWSNTTTNSFTATFTPISGATFTGTEVFYLVMDGNADADCNYDLIGVNIDIILDIEILSFSADLIEDEIHLGWVMKCEEATLELEKSFNGYDFFTIKSFQIEETGTTETFLHLDTELSNGNIYYRLKWIENNQIKYSNLKVVTVLDPKFDDLLIYPNPFKNTINIKTNGSIEGTYEVRILNSIGIEVFNKYISSSEDIDTKDLIPGNYSVIITGESFSKSFKLTK